MSDLRWLRGLLTVMFAGTDVTWRVLAAGWERDDCLGAEVKCQGWMKRFRIPLSKIREEDIRSIQREFMAQSEGQIVMTERSIQMLESEGIRLH